MLVSFALGDANPLRWPCTFLFFCVDFFALGSLREPHFQWNIGGGGSPTQHFRVGHVHFMVFIPFVSALGTQRECFSQWNMGYRVCFKGDKDRQYRQIVKPIFHQNAKYLASGAGVGQCPRRQHFALPNAKYTNMLVYFALGDAIIFALPDAKPPTPASGI